MSRTQKATRECAEWLAVCIGIGWRHADLDWLEELWWQHHDERGLLAQFDAHTVALPATAEPSTDAEVEMLRKKSDIQEQAIENRRNEARQAVIRAERAEKIVADLLRALKARVATWKAYQDISSLALTQWLNRTDGAMRESEVRVLNVCISDLESDIANAEAAR